MTARPRYLRHLTLDTGDQRDSYRHEVADDVLALLRPMIEQARLCHATIPGVPGGYTLHAWTGRGALLCEVMGPAGSTDPGPALVAFWVARDSLSSAHAWRAIVASGYATGSAPPAPWCAVSLRAGLAQHPDAAHWLGDLERCIAWAWIDQ